MIPATPLVSIVIPCRNEEAFIGPCLESIARNDHPLDRLEVLVVDGRSTDGTREVLRRCQERFPFVRVLDNPKRIIPAALNLGIREARGDVVMRLDAHCTYAPDYVSKSVRYLREWGADNVGGVSRILPRRPTVLGRAIAAAMSSRFGAGNARYRFALAEPVWADAVPLFCCRKEFLERVGGFNEDLPYSEDMEFSMRARRAGARSLLVPDVLHTYYARSDLGSFVRHNLRNGLWAVLPFRYAEGIPVSARHLVPLAGVLGVLGLGAAASLAPPAGALLLGAVALYALLALGASAIAAFKARDPLLLLAMPWVFVALHLAYGLGSLRGLVSLLASKLGPRRGRPAEV